MSHKISTQISIAGLILLAFFASPFSAYAGGVCGGLYIADAGDTVDSIAAKCGTTAAAIYAANPGISAKLSAGQTLTVPGLNYYTPVYTPVVYTPAVDYNYNNNYYNNPGYYPPANYTATYMVQYGDTFSGIAYRYGISTNALWAANPQVYNINYVYAGQILNVPASGQVVYNGYYPPYYYPNVIVAPTQESTQLSYGSAPAGTPLGKVTLSNRANGDVYVSLQGTMSDGTSVINEYPVDPGMTVKVPVGWYTYVAWVGGKKFEGQFKLNGESGIKITFFSNRVVVE